MQTLYNRENVHTDNTIFFMQSKNTMTALMSPREIGTALGVTINTVREWKNKGCPYKEANPYGIGRTSSRPRYDIEQVKSWLAEQNRKEEK